MSTSCVTNARLSGAIILFIFFCLKRVIVPNNIAFRVMSLVLQLHLVMMSKYSKFGADTFNTFLLIGYIKVFARGQRLSKDHNS